jgi:hypothetical protein
MVVELVRVDTLEAQKRVVHCQILKFSKKSEQHAVSSQVFNHTCRTIKYMWCTVYKGFCEFESCFSESGAATARGTSPEARNCFRSKPTGQTTDSSPIHFSVLRVACWISLHLKERAPTKLSSLLGVGETTSLSRCRQISTSTRSSQLLNTCTVIDCLLTAQVFDILHVYTLITLLHSKIFAWE